MTPTVARGAALELTEAVLGGPITELESNPTIGVTLGIVVEASADRVALVMVNQGAADVFIATQPNVSITNGIRLSANGGSASLTLGDDFTLCSRRWYGISGGAGNQVYVLELVRFTKTNQPTLAPKI